MILQNNIYGQSMPFRYIFTLIVLFIHPKQSYLVEATLYLVKEKEKPTC